MNDAVLQALKKLQHERSDGSPFPSHLEFQMWSDQVIALLSFDEKQRFAFKQCVTAANVSRELGSQADASGSVNRAIGLLNQTVLSLEMNSEIDQPKQTLEAPKELPFPLKFTLKWVYDHAPLSFYLWFFGLIVTAFFAGVAFSETGLYALLKGVSAPRVRTSHAVFWKNPALTLATSAVPLAYQASRPDAASIDGLSS